MTVPISIHRSVNTDILQSNAATTSPTNCIDRWVAAGTRGGHCRKQNHVYFRLPQQYSKSLSHSWHWIPIQTLPCRTRATVISHRTQKYQYRQYQSIVLNQSHADWSIAHSGSALVRAFTASYFQIPGSQTLLASRTFGKPYIGKPPPIETPIPHQIVILGLGFQKLLIPKRQHKHPNTKQFQSSTHFPMPSRR